MPSSFQFVENQVAVLDHLFHRAHADVIGDEPVGRVFQNDHVSLFAGVQASDALRPPQGGRAVDGERGHDFLGREVHVKGGQCRDQRDRLGKAAAGVEVGRKGHGAAGVDHEPAAGIGLPEAEGRGRQQGRHDTGPGHGTDPVVGGVQQVIGRNRPDLGRQFRAAQLDDLIRVQFRFQARCGGAGSTTAGTAPRRTRSSRRTRRRTRPACGRRPPAPLRRARNRCRHPPVP